MSPMGGVLSRKRARGLCPPTPPPYFLSPRCWLGRKSRRGRECRVLGGMSMTLLPAPPSHLWRLRNLKGRLIRTHPEKWWVERPRGLQSVLVIRWASRRPGIRVPWSNFHSRRLTLSWKWYFIRMGFCRKWIQRCLLMSVTLPTGLGLCSACHLLAVQSSLKQAPYERPWPVYLWQPLRIQMVSIESLRTPSVLVHVMRCHGLNRHSCPKSVLNQYTSVAHHWSSKAIEINTVSGQLLDPLGSEFKEWCFSNKIGSVIDDGPEHTGTGTCLYFQLLWPSKINFFQGIEW